MPKLYATYHREILNPTPIGIPQCVMLRKAAECPDERSLRDCVANLYAYDGVKNLRINRSGQLKKGTIVIPYEQYQQGLNIP